MGLRTSLGTKRQPAVVIYGPPGIGKTTFGAEAPEPIFLCTEDGAENIPVAKLMFGEEGRLVARSWLEVLAAIADVEKQDHDYRTLVIDTINGVTDLAQEHVCKAMFAGDWKAFNSYGQGVRATGQEIKRVLAALDGIKSRGMMVLMLSHVGTSTVKNPLGDEWTKFAPEIGRQMWGPICAWADVIGRADYEAAVVEKNGKTKAIGSGRRILRFAGSAAEDAKTRVGYELPAKMGLSCADFTALLGDNSDDRDKVADLFEGLSESRKKRFLVHYEIETLDEIPTHRVRTALAQLQKTTTK